MAYNPSYKPGGAAGSVFGQVQSAMGGRPKPAVPPGQIGQQWQRKPGGGSGPNAQMQAQWNQQWQQQNDQFNTSQGMPQNQQWQQQNDRFDGGIQDRRMRYPQNQMQGPGGMSIDPRAVAADPQGYARFQQQYAAQQASLTPQQRQQFAQGDIQSRQMGMQLAQGMRQQGNDPMIGPLEPGGGPPTWGPPGQMPQPGRKPATDPTLPQIPGGPEQNPRNPPAQQGPGAYNPGRFNYQRGDIPELMPPGQGYKASQQQRLDQFTQPRPTDFQFGNRDLWKDPNYRAQMGDISAIDLAWQQQDQANYQYGKDFNENQRRWETEQGWRQRQDQFGMGLADRQFGLSQYQAEEASKQFGAQLGFEQLRNEQQFGLQNKQFGEGQRQFNQQFGLQQQQFGESQQQFRQRMALEQAQFGQGQKEFGMTFGEGRRQFDVGQANEQNWRKTQAQLQREQMAAEGLNQRYAVFGRAQAGVGPGRVMRAW